MAAVLAAWIATRQQQVKRALNGHDELLRRVLAAIEANELRDDRGAVRRP